MANRALTVIATAVAAACSLSAQAAGPTQADFAKVVLYSNVTIAQDSPNQWGVWEELEPPAAGPQAPLPVLLPSSAGYRPLGEVTSNTPITPVTPEPPVASGPCSSGSFCGFGVITYSSTTISFDSPAQAADVNDPSGETPMLGMGFRLLPTATAPDTETATPTNWYPQAMNIATESVRQDTSEQAPAFTGLGPMNFDGVNAHSTRSGEDVTTSATLSTDHGELPSDATSGRFLGSIVRYVSGSNSFTFENASMHGFWGVTTTAADMVQLRQSQAVANYSGFTFDANGNRLGDVNMSVQFGAGTFTANFGAGLDTTNPLAGAQPVVTQSGVTQINGVLSFQASGTISGSQFTSNQLKIAGPGNSITGKVDGAFFGSEAKVAAGVADVSVVVLPVSQTTPVSGRYTGAFMTVKGGINPEAK